MAYVVRAIHPDGVRLAVTVEKNTLREAKESAKSLREEGMWAIITGPDGKTIDETPSDGGRVLGHPAHRPGRIPRHPDDYWAGRRRSDD